MTVAVTFPDGTIRQVVGALKLEHDRFVQCPINCDPHWRYEWKSDRWVAISRHVRIRALPRIERGTWWDNISCMTRDDETIADDHVRAHRSAA